MKMPSLLLNALLFTLLACTASARSPEEQSVIDFLDAYDRAYTASDVTFFEKNFHPDYRVFVEGELKTKADSIEWIKTKDSKERTLELSSTIDRVRIAGDMAVATGTINWKTMKPGEENATAKTGSEHVTIVMVKDGNAWRAWSEHLSSVKAASAK